MPTNRPTKQREQERHALDHQQRGDDQRRCRSETIAYWPSVQSLPVCSSRLRSSAGLGISVEAKPVDPGLARLAMQLADLRLGVRRRATSPCRSLIISRRRLTRLARPTAR